jgi:hypothetical protein
MSSFPVGKYARYKRATTIFLDWLLQAQSLSRHVRQPLKLSAFSGVVQEVAQDPSRLTPKLLSDLPKALAMCRCSITLREHVASFFADDDKGQIGHRHFLGLLKSWYAKLKTVQLEPQQQAAVEAESTRFENYYEVLEVDQDYFPNDTESKPESSASGDSLADRDRLFNEAFAEDLRLEVVYFFLELEELVEGVYTIYSQVKKEQRSMVEATVAAKVAMDAASALTAKLQLRYPALKRRRLWGWC